MSLPERTLYNLDQLSVRWQCNPEDVLHYVERGLLYPHFSISAHCRHERWEEEQKRWYPVDMLGRETDFLCNKGLDFDDPLYIGRRCCVMSYTGIFPLLESAWFPHDWPFEVPLCANWQGDLKGSWLYSKFFNDRIALLESHLITPADFLFPLAEIQRFEAEYPPIKDTTTAPPHTAPPKELLKSLVARAAWELQKESGKFPQYRAVLDKLRHMSKIEDQAGAIIESVDLDDGISIIGRDNPIAIKTVKNWLGDIKKSVHVLK